MGDEGGLSSTVVGSFTVEGSSGMSSDELKENLGPEGEPKPDEKTEEQKKSEAASELGKAGGKATAEKRAAEAKEGEKKPDAEVEKKDAKAEGAPEKKPETDEEKVYREEGEKRKRDAKTRVEEATRKEAEAKQERDEAKADAARLRAELDARDHPPPKPAAAPAHGARPRASEFPDTAEGADAYLNARDTWHEKEMEKRWEERDRQREAQRREQAAVAEVDEKIRTHVQKLHAVLTDAGVEITEESVLGFEPEFSLPEGTVATGENWIANELISSPEHAPALVLHFKEHPDVLQRIAALPNPRAVSREMAKLEDRLAAAIPGTAISSAERDDDASKASPPITPVKGAPYVDEGEEPDPKMGFEKYHAIRNKQMRSRR